jgi:hypothetical protein
MEKNMTLTISKNFNDDLKIEFIKQSIPIYNIKRITIEKDPINDEINIEAKDSENSILLIEKIKKITSLVISNTNTTDTVIVLWK